MKKISLIAFFVALSAGITVWVMLQKKTTDDFELDHEKQQFIWDSEHITFEIENYFGKPLAQALKQGNDESIRNLANDQFKSTVLDIAKSDKKTIGTFTEESWTDEGEETDIEGFISFFRQMMKDFQVVDRAKTRVLHIDPVEGDSFAWDTELLLTLHGKSKKGFPIQISSHHHARFRYEKDEEIQTGKTLLSWKSVDLKVTHASQPLFKEITSQVGFANEKLPDNWTAPVGKTSQFLFQIAVEDMDLDGDYDIAMATYGGTPILLCMEEGRYVDRSSELGLATWDQTGPNKSALAGWVDIDNDNYPDLILGQSLYKNVGGLRFKDITKESGFNVGFEPHGISVADYNCDGLLDIYVSHPRAYQQEITKAGWVGDQDGGAPNRLWKNLGNGKFEDVTVEANAGGGNKTTFTSSWFYFDDDHYPDLYLANDFTKNVVLRNRGDGTFEDISDSTVAADFATSMGVATGDLNNDGKTEIYVANMYSKMGRRIISHVAKEDYPEGIFEQIQGSCAGNRLYAIGDDGNYADVTDVAKVNEVGWAFAPLFCDFDGDGLLDIYATTGFMSFSREKPDG